MKLFVIVFVWALLMSLSGVGLVILSEASGRSWDRGHLKKSVFQGLGACICGASTMALGLWGAVTAAEALSNLH
jgi:hypothetical protein